jgi:hypothetical protein
MLLIATILTTAIMQLITGAITDSTLGASFTAIGLRDR